MIKLTINNNGVNGLEQEFKGVEELVTFLEENREDLFGWILEEEPDFEIPVFEGATSAREIEAILNELDFSWWTAELDY